MAWPSDSLTTTHTDQDTDSPASARAEIDAAIDTLKLVLAEVTAGETVWHSGNDGSGSTLDADTVDGSDVGTGDGDIPNYDGTTGRLGQVYRYDQSGNNTGNITLSSLTGDTWGNVEIDIFFKEPTSVGIGNYIQFNGDTTAGNYFWHSFYVQGANTPSQSTSSASTTDHYIDIGGPHQTYKSTHMKITMDMTSGIKRILKIEYFSGGGSGSTMRTGWVTGTWLNTADSITSITLGLAANRFSDGSTVTIRRV